jgi:drug/metabolite transporter (DMT)-like permease
MELAILATILSGATSKILNKIGSHKVSIYLILLIQNIAGAAVSFTALLMMGDVHVFLPEIHYVLFGINTILWLLTGVLSFQGIRHTQASVRESLTQSRLIFVPLIAVVFLGEHMTLGAVLGSMLVFAGIVVAVYKKELSLAYPDERGIGYVLAASVLIAVASSLDKQIVSTGLDYFQYAFLLNCALTVIYLFFFTRERRKECVEMLQHSSGFFVIGAGIATGVFYLLQLFLYKNLDLHIAYPFIQLASAFALILAIVFLKEWDRIFFKIFGFCIAAAGAIVLRLSA